MAKFSLNNIFKFSKLNMRALETLCYILGAGAFAVFIRWLQVTAGTTEDGLFNKTVWNYLVPIVIIASFLILMNITRKLIKNRFFIDEDTSVCLKNTGKLHAFFRIVIGLIMAGGAALLFLTCETDQEATLLKVVSLLGVVCGISYSWLMKAYNKPETNKDLMCAAATVPLVMFAVWLIATYKSNDINGVVWAYGVEVIAICFALFAFFRAAGFAYGVLDLKKFLNANARGIFMLIVALADSRNMGLQIMLIGAICMLIYYEWLIISNFKQREAPISYQPRDGFEHMY